MYDSPMPRALYLKLHATDGLRRMLLLSDLLGFGSALVTAAAALYTKTPIILLDAALTFVLVLLQRRRGLATALVWAVYSGSSTLLLAIEEGVLSGAVPLLAALLCVVGQRRLEHEMWEARDEL